MVMFISQLTKWLASVTLSPATMSNEAAVAFCIRYALTSHYWTQGGRLCEISQPRPLDLATHLDTIPTCMK